MIWDDFFVSIYTISDAVAVYGLIRMHHVCSMEGLTATYEVESAALRGWKNHWNHRLLPFLERLYSV